MANGGISGRQGYQQPAKSWPAAVVDGGRVATDQKMESNMTADCFPTNETDAIDCFPTNFCALPATTTMAEKGGNYYIFEFRMRQELGFGGCS